MKNSRYAVWRSVCRRNIGVRVIALLLVAALAAPSAAVAAERNDSVYFVAKQDSGDALTVTFSIPAATDVYAYDLVVGYDSKRLKLDSAKVSHNGFMVEPIVKEGRIRVAYTLIGPKPGLKGNIDLVSVHFNRIADGPAVVELEAVKLVDSAIGSIQYKPGIKSVLIQSPAFADIRNHWARETIEQAVRLGIVNGFEDGTYRPQERISRMQFAVMTARALKLSADSADAPTFIDNADIPDWAQPHVAAITGLIVGYEDGSFRPNRFITRVEMAAIAARTGIADTDGQSESTFADDMYIPEWAKSDVSAVVAQNIMKGRDGNRFAPEAHTTRAEAIVVIMRLLGHV